jgi:phosphatidylglycerophosphatase A
MVSALTPSGRALVTMGGLGAIRPAPGTWGSLPPVVVAAVLIAAGVSPAGSAGASAAYHIILIGIMVAATLACAIHGDAAEAHFDKKDPGNVVADETAGQVLPLLFLPPAAVASPGIALLTLAYAFVAFRVMDILKPPPARQLQRIPGGWGIVIDDLLAGVYAMVVVQVVVRVML